MTFQKKEGKKASAFKNRLSHIPSYLKIFMTEQNYDRYTPRDHAVWRFIMRQARELFEERAHPIYLKGLSKTGVPISRIPNIKEMDEILSQFGWGAVCVRGFIPPQIFLEFFAHKILPIAADMRSIENIAYTPAPDIVHEAAGHAPILADPAYAEFLEKFGKIATKGIYSDEDIELYEAIRVLSDIKENPDSTKEEVQKAEESLEKTVNKITWTSEASKLSRLFWWTAEYGLVGSQENPQIYGAGLLSSLGEGKSCLKQDVEKINLTTGCTNQSFDITKPQPQLFVTSRFENLSKILDDFSETLSYKNSGKESLEMAKKSKSVTTVAFDDGFSVTGILTDYKKLEEPESFFLQWKDPIQLCQDGSCLNDYKSGEYAKGFSLCVGESNLKKCKASCDKTLRGKITSVYGGACDRECFDVAEQAVSESLPVRTSPFTEEEKSLFVL